MLVAVCRGVRPDAVAVAHQTPDLGLGAHADFDARPGEEDARPLRLADLNLVAFPRNGRDAARVAGAARRRGAVGRGRLVLAAGRLVVAAARLVVAAVDVQKVAKVVVVQLNVRHPHEEQGVLLRRGALHGLEDVADRARRDARVAGLARHRKRLARPGVAVRKDRRVVTISRGQHQRPRRLINLLLRALRAEDAVERKGFCDAARTLGARWGLGQRVEIFRLDEVAGAVAS
mmetsp:Transcript_14727/g.49401  ORF Transcript_14727/g.49401 Transcript_14727/m.49401 type:complete len:232 (-) Transcript_14727:110-805(-)